MTTRAAHDAAVTKVLARALDVAAEAPLEQHKYAHAAKVKWRLIHELREALEVLGVDWRAFRAEHVEGRPRTAGAVVREQHRGETP